MSEPIASPDVPPVPLVVRSRRDPAATRRRWVERMGRFATSSLTVAEFCAAEGVSVPAFYQWKRVLAAGDTPLSPGTPPTFVPVRIAPTNAPGVELVLPSGAILRFPPGTDPATIAAVVRHLGGESC
jgi:transposase